MLQLMPHSSSSSVAELANETRGIHEAAQLPFVCVRQRAQLVENDVRSSLWGRSREMTPRQVVTMANGRRQLGALPAAGNLQSSVADQRTMHRFRSLRSSRRHVMRPTSTTTSSKSAGMLTPLMRRRLPQLLLCRRAPFLVWRVDISGQTSNQ